jgi:hypothetical protein
MTGWGTTAVNRNDDKALKVDGKVVVPSEAVRLSYETNGYRHNEQRRDEETPRLIEHLTSHGFTVRPSAGKSLLVTKESDG